MTTETAAEMIEAIRRRGTLVLSASEHGYCAMVSLDRQMGLSDCRVKSDSDMKTLEAALRQLIDRCEAAPRGYLMGVPHA